MKLSENPSIRAPLPSAAILACLALTSACSRSGEETPQAKSEREAPIFSEQIKALEDAGKVEKALQQAEEIRRKKIEEQMQ